MSKDKVDYSQFPDSSIPVFYSIPKGYITYIGTLIPKHHQRKVYLMSPKRAYEVLDLIPYQEYLDGDITKEGKFIHRAYGKKMDFRKLVQPFLSALDDGANPLLAFQKLIAHYPYSYTKEEVYVDTGVSTGKKDKPCFNTDLGYRFDLDF